MPWRGDRRDGDVFVMGEEVAEYQGAYKVTQGLLCRVRRGPECDRYADHRARFAVLAPARLLAA